MKIARIVLWLCFCILTQGLVFSQATPIPDVPPPVFDPAQMLTENAQLLEVYRLAHIDDRVYKVFYFDPDTREWSAFAYPDYQLAIQGGYWQRQLASRGDGTYLFGADLWRPVSKNPSPNWIFDPHDKTTPFTLVETVACGVIKTTPDTGRWLILAENEETGPSYLCFTETGEISPPIPTPAEYPTCLRGMFRWIEMSPDKRFVVFVCGIFGDASPSAIYSYDREERIFHQLSAEWGYMSEAIGVKMWLDDVTAVMYFQVFQNSQRESYSIVDVTQDHSEYVADGHYLFTNPVRVESFYCEFTSCGPGGPYALHSYDLTERALTIYPVIERINGLSLIIPDGTGDRLYRALEYEKAGDSEYIPHASLLRFNYETGQIQEILTGGIEWIDSVSPDGRYVALYWRRDGKLNNNLTLGYRMAGYEADLTATYAIVDLTTNNIVFDAPGAGDDVFGRNPYLRFDVDWPTRWFDNRQFWVSYGEYPGGFTVVYRLHGDRIGGEIVGVYWLSNFSPDGKRIVAFDADKRLVVYDSVTGKEIQITRKPVGEPYRISATWMDDSTLEMTISGYADYAHWKIRVVL